MPGKPNLGRSKSYNNAPRTFAPEYYDAPTFNYSPKQLQNGIIQKQVAEVNDLYKKSSEAYSWLVANPATEQEKSDFYSQNPLQYLPLSKLNVNPYMMQWLQEYRKLAGSGKPTEVPVDAKAAIKQETKVRQQRTSRSAFSPSLLSETNGSKTLLGE